jgi:hypothetical protein
MQQGQDESEGVEQNNFEDGDDEALELTPAQLVDLLVESALEDMFARQVEVLRLATYIQLRASEIDDYKARAKEEIRRTLDGIDEDAFGGVWEAWQTRMAEDEGESVNSQERLEAFSAAMDEVAETLPEGAIHSYLGGVLSATVRGPSVPMIYRSLLVTLVGELEVFVGRVARALLLVEPDALEASDRKFTWNEISKYDTLDDLKARVIDRAVEDLLRDSMDEALKFFDRRFGIKAPKIMGTFAAKEAIQRRHVVVHNGSRVSSQYIERLQDFPIEVERDDMLSVDLEYLRSTADTLFVCGMGLAFSARMRKGASAEATQRDLSNRLYELLIHKRPQVVELVASEVDADRLHESTQLVYRVNVWLAMQAVGKTAECRAEVEAFDVSTRNREYVLAKHALLGEDAEAYELAQKMLRDDELPAQGWLAWPLLAGAREYERRMKAASVADENGDA